MNKVRGLSIIAITLLILQLFTANLGMITISQASNNENRASVTVESTNVSDDTLTWEVAVTAVAEEEEIAKTKITFSAGHSHDAIDHNNQVNVEKMNDSYVVETPADGATHKVKVTTKVTDESQTTFKLNAATKLAGIETKDDAQVEVEREEKVIEDNAENSDDEQGESEKATEENKAVQKEAENSEEEAEVVVQENNSDGTDNSTEEAKENEKSDVNEENSEMIEDEVEGVPHPAFQTTAFPNAIPGVMSGDNWPAPGSLKLDKTASETGNYAEWEVELNVEGKNLKTKSDIVLVFDKSNSMYDSRLNKAKTAAIQFVDNLLIKDSTVRIALVSFATTANMDKDFTGYSGKDELKSKINEIDRDGGTNIQAGLHQADLLLSQSNADKKTIVLLSDGTPTYSFKAGQASSYNWPNDKYNFILSDFNYNSRIGNGSSYDLPGGIFGNQRYSVGGYRVTTNGIPTISEAKHIMNSGIDIYSVGLEVGNDADATYVLQNSQNKGYYAGGDDDMTPIFNDIAASLAYAATNAVVTDPLGDMFDLVKDGSYSGANFEVSNGSVSWDDSTETFTWNIGNVKEDETYTFKYKIMLDCTKEPKGEVEYPTNKTTPLNYKDSDGNSATKQFPIPKVSFNTGEITKIGYRVNIDGDPVDSTGNVVNSPSEAEQFYEELFGEDLAFGNTYDVPANDVTDYTLLVGENPTSVSLTTNKVCETVWFGYVKTSEMEGKIEITKKDEDGALQGATFELQDANNNIVGTETSDQNGKITFDKLPFGEYTLIETDAPEGYELITDPIVITIDKDNLLVEKTINNEKKKGKVIVTKVDKENSEALSGAKFVLKDANGNPVGPEESTNIDGQVVFEDLAWGDYTLVETAAPQGYEASGETINITISKTELLIEKTIENTRQKGKITITKIGEKNDPLANAEFTLTGPNDFSETISSNSEGQVVFEDLEWGDYTLTETKAPEGYRLLKKDIEITIDQENINIEKEIENTKQGWEIPKTGGIGTLGFYGAGFMLMAGAGWFIFRRRQS